MLKIFDIIFNNPLRIAVANFLSTIIIGTIDYWAFLHILVGIIFVYLFFNVKKFKRFKKKPFLWVFIFAVGFEIIEWMFFLTKSRFFIPETLFNSVLDVGFNLLGAWLYLKFKK